MRISRQVRHVEQRAEQVTTVIPLEAVFPLEARKRNQRLAEVHVEQVTSRQHVEQHAEHLTTVIRKKHGRKTRKKEVG